MEHIGAGPQEGGEERKKEEAEGQQTVVVLSSHKRRERSAESGADGEEERDGPGERKRICAVLRVFQGDDGDGDSEAKVVLHCGAGDSATVHTPGKQRIVLEVASPLMTERHAVARSQASSKVGVETKEQAVEKEEKEEEEPPKISTGRPSALVACRLRPKRDFDAELRMAMQLLPVCPERSVDIALQDPTVQKLLGGGLGEPDLPMAFCASLEGAVQLQEQNECLSGISRAVQGASPEPANGATFANDVSRKRQQQIQLLLHTAWDAVSSGLRHANCLQHRPQSHNRACTAMTFVEMDRQQDALEHRARDCQVEYKKHVSRGTMPLGYNLVDLAGVVATVDNGVERRLRGSLFGKRWPEVLRVCETLDPRTLLHRADIRHAVEPILLLFARRHAFWWHVLLELKKQSTVPALRVLRDVMKNWNALFLDLEWKWGQLKKKGLGVQPRRKAVAALTQMSMGNGTRAVFVPSTNLCMSVSFGTGPTLTTKQLKAKRKRARAKLRKQQLQQIQRKEEEGEEEQSLLQQKQQQKQSPQRWVWQAPATSHPEPYMYTPARRTVCLYRNDGNTDECLQSDSVWS